MELFNLKLLSAPSWTGRNKLIAEQWLEPNKTLLDLGCGNKDILKYYTPTKYLGVDGVSTADVVLDLDGELDLPKGWDYVLNSGILEYIDNLDSYFIKIKPLGSKFIFTWWQGEGWGRLPPSRIKSMIEEHYNIEQQLLWGKQHIFFCKI